MKLLNRQKLDFRTGIGGSLFQLSDNNINFFRKAKQFVIYERSGNHRPDTIMLKKLDRKSSFLIDKRIPKDLSKFLLLKLQLKSDLL